ncbi:archease [candidate division NPL-UPA2 bacterium Unc8]|uniref:Archease n=1 Tax=candidate division NPL-UPA2 bacterium Unc8 TaxID=1980939 RepID=A0A399FXF6_UNCN2|nr:Protein archease [Bacillota bacterium]MBT9138762.1 Protein archease [Bacillota bacterium]MBT9146536.1 Protein archease [Bacillota bacterium]RIH99822.1 MAG: archease [candidate division NPL-UPA2 bacterium Unc8]
MKNYELIEHTADIGIRISGKRKEDIFINAAYAMLDIMVESCAIDSKLKHSLFVKAADIEELLVCFLNELIYLFVSKEFLPAKFKIIKVNSKCLSVEVSGEKFNPKRHKLKTEIKAATYHNLRIEKNTAGYQTEVIFDV